VVFSVLVVVPIRLAQNLGVHVRAPSVERPLLLADGLAGRRSARLSLHTFGAFVLAMALAAYAIWVLITGAEPSRDVRLLAVSMALILSLGLLLRWRRADAGWADKIALYSSAVLAIFLSKHSFPDAFSVNGARATHVELVECILFPILALSVVVCIRSSGDRPFKITPLDILVLLVVLTVPNLPNSIASARSLGWTIAESVLLFYSLEALTQSAGQHWRWLSGATAVFLIALALRAIV
jgi:hypothetical protein